MGCPGPFCFLWNLALLRYLGPPNPGPPFYRLPFLVTFLHPVWKGFQAQHEAILRPTWDPLGRTWWDLGVQLGAQLRKVGSKLGPDAPKIGFLRVCLAYVQGVPHRIDFWMDFGSIVVLPCSRRTHFKDFSSSR